MLAQLNLNPDVVCSPLEDGAVLFDLTTKQYFALNASGLVAWQYFEDGGSPDALSQALLTFGVPAPDNGIAAFADVLIEHGLAARGGASTTAAVALPTLPSSWTEPLLKPHGRPLADVILSPFDPTVPVPE